MRHEITKEDQDAVDKWLKEGNKITVCEYGAQTDPELLSYTWGAKKKKKPEDAK